MWQVTDAESSESSASAETLAVVGAFGPEIRPLEAFVNKMPGEILLQPVGIGCVDAALGVQELIRTWGGDPSRLALLFVGTAGAYAGSGLEIGDVAWVSSTRMVGWHKPKSRADWLGPIGEQLRPTWPVEPASLAHGALKAAHVGTSLTIGGNRRRGSLVARHYGVQLEHLEAYGVARACVLAGVRWGALLGVSNVVCEAGRRQWASNHRWVSELVAAYARGVLLG